ncbi:hypothetical protein QN277_016573 [Acacia crassicarpa]|uniref:Uncharacterized protein n=1 Tax=Acacia crassicarpa TaxID=499986 RepID=A0AAE1MWX8_9FABA|nr:hypothetical protein QN277_016573 [Acacia crassicarpa]
MRFTFHTFYYYRNPKISDFPFIRPPSPTPTFQISFSFSPISKTLTQSPVSVSVSGFVSVSDFEIQSAVPAPSVPRSSVLVLHSQARSSLFPDLATLSPRLQLSGLCYSLVCLISSHQASATLISGFQGI